MEGCVNVLTKNQLIGIWAALLFLSLCSLAGERDRENRELSEPYRMAYEENASKGAVKEAAGGTENIARAVKNAGENEARQNEGIFLTDSQRTLLEGLLAELDRRDLEAAGRRMNQYQQELAGIFYETSGGRACRFVPRTKQEPARLEWELSGNGLVLKGPGLIFYGDITEEGLDGQGISLRFSGIGRPRYDYAVGFWKNGRLDGQGTIGYHYYEGAKGEEVVKVEKEGTFQNDLLNGPFVYKSTNGNGRESLWTMEADKGILVFDENWEYLEDKMEYRLMSNKNKSHVYVVPESIAAQASWRNLLVWNLE